MRENHNQNDTIERKCGSVEIACLRYSLGRHTMIKVARDAQAVIRIGKRVLINFEKTDAYMNALSRD